MKKSIYEQKFELRYYTRRVNYEQTITFVINDEGWDLESFEHGSCGPTGDAFESQEFDLWSMFYRDSVNYPKYLPDYLRELWKNVHENEPEQSWTQERFDELGKWISETEKNTPQLDPFDILKG